MKNVILSFFMILMLFGCTQNDNDTTQGNDAKSSKTVYLITMDKIDQHWVAVNAGAKFMADSLNLKYKWDAPDVKDNAKQIEILNNAIADKADVILLAANDPDAIADTVERAIEQGIEIVYVDSPANVPAKSTLLTNNEAAGVLQAQTLLDQFALQGITSGSIGVIGTNTATKSTIDREKGFRRTFEGTNFTILTSEYKDGDAAASQEAAIGFIVANDDLVGLAGMNEGSSVGIGNAIKAQEENVIGVGFDKSDAILSLVKEGYIKGVMAQNPFTMGFLGVAQAYAILEGKPIGPAIIDTGVSVVTE